MRPYVILNAAMTLDGKIATRTGSSEISGPKDLIRVHQLRKELDAIMIGINTLLADDSRLTVHKIESKPEDNPIRIVIDSKAKTPITARILNNDAPTIIAVSKKAPKEKINQLEEKAKVIITGDERVDLKNLMYQLKQLGINSLMLEGGSTLNFSMIEAGLVDEIRICIAPMIAGGTEAISLVGGNGFDYMADSKKLKFKNSFELDKDLILCYDVLND
jgi:2,5-diamino-6-(ribosylamino)-4(3H)-pyrimidinone 5'-phosphate reductase